MKHAICAGDQNFVYAIDGVGSIVWGYPLSSSNTSQGDFWFPWVETTEQEEDLQLGGQEFVLNSVLAGDCPMRCGCRSGLWPRPLRAPCAATVTAAVAVLIAYPRRSRSQATGCRIAP